VEAQHHRPGIPGPEIPHQARPDPPGRAELRHLLQQRRTSHKEEGQPRAEVVDRQAGIERCLDVRESVAQRERDLLRRRRPGLGHVIAGDGYRVPLWNLGTAVGERIRDQRSDGLGG
jgi:hypothetical protein